MSKLKVVIFIVLSVIGLMSMTFETKDSSYYNLYNKGITEFNIEQQTLIKLIESQKEFSSERVLVIKKQIDAARMKLKGIDFWLRYLNPTTYHLINGPLPVEWETEVLKNLKSHIKEMAQD